ncbi:MAG: hypothetical protein AAF993_08740 [Pseudomonadota bacterium]
MRTRILSLSIVLMLWSGAAFAQGGIAVPPGPPMGLYHFFVKTNCYSLAQQYEEWTPYWPWETAVPVFPGNASIVGVTISAPDLIYIRSSHPGVIPAKNGWQLAGPSNGLAYPKTRSTLQINEPKNAPTIVRLDSAGQYPLQMVLGFVDDLARMYLLGLPPNHNLALSVYPRQELKRVTLTSPKPVYTVGDTINLRGEWGYVNPQNPRVVVARAILDRVTMPTPNGPVVVPLPESSVPVTMALDEGTRYSNLGWQLQLPNYGPTSQSSLQSSLIATLDLNLHVKAVDTSNSCNLLKGPTEHTVRIKVANPHYAPAQTQRAIQPAQTRTKQPRTKQPNMAPGKHPDKTLQKQSR